MLSNFQRVSIRLHPSIQLSGVRFAERYGRRWVTGALVHFFRKAFRWASDMVEFSRQQLISYRYNCTPATALMMLPQMYRVTTYAWRANRCPIVKKTPERQSKPALVWCGETIRE